MPYLQVSTCAIYEALMTVARGRCRMWVWLALAPRKAGRQAGVLNSGGRKPYPPPPMFLFPCYHQVTISLIAYPP